ncbi:MAG TPA: ATP-binding cassette domain-containing protein [Firmicutes bacterium]|nr:ATP-binding cassette domain-containing protein [Bacillota bacterium]
MKRTKENQSIVIVAAIALGLLPLFDSNPYHLRLLTTISLYVVLALGLNVLVGLAGLLDMGYIAFYAIGAYVYALLASPQLGVHLPFLTVLPLAVLIAVGVSLLIGLATLRLRGDYLAVVTMSFAEILRIFLTNLDRPVNITNGPNGIVEIDPPRFGALTIATPQQNYYLLLLFALAAYLVYTRLIRSQTGLKWRALRDDVIAAQSLGVDPLHYQMLAYATGAAFASTAGVLFSAWQGAVFPQNFTLGELITVYCMVILGGTGNQTGTLLGVVALVLVPEILRTYSVYRMAIYGILLVIMMIYRPQGILPQKPGLCSMPRGGCRKERKVGLAPCNEPVLVVRNITKRFEGLLVLDGVSFELRRGEVLSIIGPNGAGKTTLINILTGVTKPDDGEFFLKGKKLNGLKPHTVYKLGLSRTFQNLRLFKGMTVAENVLVGLDLTAATGAGDVLEFLDRDLALRQDQPADGLSYAHRKILEVARAIAGNPEVILLDEPAAGMNPAELQELMERINTLKHEGYSIVLVEHQMPLVAGVSDRVIVLDHGRKIAEGPPENVMADQGVVEVYLGHQIPYYERAISQLTSRPMLELSEVEAGYDRVKVLHGISLEVKQGEVVCLLGANGAGKTTTIKTILGSLKPDRGKICFKGEDITGENPFRVVRKGIGLVPEGRRIFSRMTVEENLKLGSSDADAMEYVYSLFPRLKERRQQRAGTLSGGEQQMLAIGRALMMRPELLLLDEPSMGLAPVMVDRIFEAILELNRNGTTILMVEQNARRALQVAHRGYVLQNGRIAAAGPSRQLLESETLRSAYFGDPAQLSHPVFLTP